MTFPLRRHPDIPPGYDYLNAKTDQCYAQPYARNWYHWHFYV